MPGQPIKYPFLDLGTANESYMAAMREAAMRVINSGRYIGGEEVEAFNREMAAMCDAPHAIGVSNGLDALRLIFEGYKVLGKLSVGDEIIVPANTYIATILAIGHAGLTPVLVDPDQRTMNLSVEGIQRGLSQRTRGIVAVHLFGRVCWDNDIARICRANDLLVIEDAAQAIGARAATEGLFRSRAAGAIGHAGAFSFYPTKNVGALGDAGAVVTHDEVLADAVKALDNYGSDRRYHNIYAGFNCRLDPIQAAMIRVKLPDTDKVNAERFARAVAYDRHISHPAVIKPLMPATPTQCVWHQYVVRISDGRRDDFREYLRKNGVETDIHYPTPPHMQPCYAAETAHAPLPLTERLAKEVVSLPIGASTSEADAREIAAIINNYPNI